MFSVGSMGHQILSAGALEFSTRGLKQESAKCGRAPNPAPGFVLCKEAQNVLRGCEAKNPKEHGTEIRCGPQSPKYLVLLEKKLANPWLFRAKTV